MSWFHRVFGTRGDRAPTTEEATVKLDEILERLQKRADFLETKIAEQTELARSNAKTNRRVALNALSRRRRMEKELQSLDHTTSNVEYQRDALCNARAQTEMFEAMRAGGRALQAALNSLSVDDVESLQDDIDEQLQVAEEMRGALSRPLWGNDADTDEIADELEQMMLDDDLTTVKNPVTADSPASPTGKLPVSTGTGHSARLPDVPRHDPAKKGLSRGEEDELAELSSWAGVAQ